MVAKWKVDRLPGQRSENRAGREERKGEERRPLRRSRRQAHPPVACRRSIRQGPEDRRRALGVQRAAMVSKWRSPGGNSDRPSRIRPGNKSDLCPQYSRWEDARTVLPARIIQHPEGFAPWTADQLCRV